MNTTTRGISWVIFLFCLAFTACQKTNKEQLSEPIQLGALFSLSGSKSDLGIPSARGAQLAVAQLNEKGGILDREVQLLVKDGESDASVGAQQVATMMQEAPDIAAFLGLSDTDLALSAATESSLYDRVFLTSGATSPLLPAQVPDYLFLACFGDNVQAAAAAEWAYDELNLRTAVVVYDTLETYTVLLQKYFIDRFESLGGQVLAAKGYNPIDRGAILQNLPTAELVFLSSGSAQDARSSIQLMREAGITAPVIGGDGYESETEWEAHPQIQDVFYTTHAYLGADNLEPRVKEFNKIYTEAYGGALPDAFAALGYDAVNLLAKAIEKTASTDPLKVQQALAQLSDFSGVTGDISFSTGQQIPSKSVTFMEVKGGKRIYRDALIPKVIPQP